MGQCTFVKETEAGCKETFSDFAVTVPCPYDVSGMLEKVYPGDNLEYVPYTWIKGQWVDSPPDKTQTIPAIGNHNVEIQNSEGTVTE